MAPRQRGLPIHGWVILDKPLGMSSSRAVGAVRRCLGAAKAGHGGTLDPLATGVLPIALGEATKTVSYVMGGRKAYRFALCWGEARDTDDAEGRVIATSPERPSRAAIEAVLDAFRGRISQMPPAYSALKRDGARAYELARAGQVPDLAARPVEVDRLDLVDLPDPDHATFEAVVGKGTYIRALGRDLGRELGCYAYVTALKRLSVGPFALDRAISLDKLVALGHSAATSEHLLPLETALDDIPALALTEDEVRALRCGQAVARLRLQDRAPLDGMMDGATIRATSNGRLVALVAVEAGLIRPVRVMNHWA